MPDAQETTLTAARAVFRHGKPAHLAAARMTAHALTAADYDTWAAWATVAEARLSAAERAALAFFALSSLSTDQARAVAEAALDPAGETTPLPPLRDALTEARWWARAVAGPAERRAYALAAAEALPPAEQAQLRDWLQGRSAA